MIGLGSQTSRDSIVRATVPFAVLAAILLVVMTQMPTGFCDDDCAGQCSTDCDCLSCVTFLPMVIAPGLELGIADESFGWPVPTTQYRYDLSPVSDIDHPPQLSA